VKKPVANVTALTRTPHVHPGKIIAETTSM